MCELSELYFTKWDHFACGVFIIVFYYVIPDERDIYMVMPCSEVI